MADPVLRDVSKPVIEPPYPDDVVSNGYGFVLNMQRVEQSKTWVIAPSELRPWLLMLWCRSWQQRPTGSLPDDDDVIAAIIGMPIVMFTTHRRMLMSGWERASDGRLYHRVVTTLVLDMLRGRKNMTERQRRWREEKKAASQPVKTQGVTRDSRVNNALVTVSHGEDRVGVGVGVGVGLSQSQSRLPQQRGKRLPTDWSLPPDWREWTVKTFNANPAKVDQIAQAFRDFWIAKAGPNAVKLDWQATWRNWVRREFPNTTPATTRSKQVSL